MNERIMIVEDTPANIQTLTGILGREAAYSGQATQLARRTRL